MANRRYHQPPKRKVRYRVKRTPSQMLVRISILAAGAALVVFLICVLVAYSRIGFSERLTAYPGVTIDGIDVSSMTREQATQAVQAQVQGKLDQARVTLTLEGKDNTWSYDWRVLEGAANVEQVVDQAFTHGREGGIFYRSGQIAKVKRQGLALTTEITYNLDALMPELAQIKQEHDVPVQQAQVEFTPDAAEIFNYEKESTGYEIHTEEVLAAIREDFASDSQAEVRIALHEVAPTTTVEMLEGTTKRIAYASTDLTDNKKRTNNIRKSLAAINGTVLQPGERLSFNTATGERTAENGYQEAPVIKPDKSVVNDLGGGVCQSSTTLYNAVLKSDLKIVERHHHSFPLTYAPAGLDASVSYETADFIFENNQENPIYIRAYVTAEEAVVIIYGSPLPYKISLESEIYQESEVPEAETIKDTEGKYVTYTDESYVAVASRKDVWARSYKIYKNESGEEIKRDLIQDDHYESVVGKIYVGVKERGSQTPSTSQPPRDTPTPDDHGVAD